jgi:hypothetical protein
MYFTPDVREEKAELIVYIIVDLCTNNSHKYMDKLPVIGFPIQNQIISSLMLLKKQI